MALGTFAYAATHTLVPAFVRSRIEPYARPVERAARQLLRWQGRPGKVKLVRCVSSSRHDPIFLDFVLLFAYPRAAVRAHHSQCQCASLDTSLLPSSPTLGTLRIWATETLFIFGLGDDKDYDGADDNGAALSDARQMTDGGTGEERIPLWPSPSLGAEYGAMVR
jgi:hypothetical protein